MALTARENKLSVLFPGSKNWPLIVTVAELGRRCLNLLLASFVLFFSAKKKATTIFNAFPEPSALRAETTIQSLAGRMSFSSAVPQKSKLTY